MQRGLGGVRLMISDAHEGLKHTIGKVLGGASWQRRVHFMRNLLALVPHGAQEAVAAIVRTVFAQPDHASALAQLQKVVEGLQPRFAQAATLLADAAEDLLAHKHFPAEHRTRLHSTNPLEPDGRRPGQRPAEALAATLRRKVPPEFFDVGGGCVWGRRHRTAPPFVAAWTGPSKIR